MKIRYGLKLIAACAFALIILPASGGADTLIECLGGEGDGGDAFLRGFYITSYPGSTLDNVDLWLMADTIGEYVVQLHAWADQYEGASLGTSEVTVTIPEVLMEETLTAFPFPSMAVTPHGIVAFKLDMVSGPGSIYYGTETSNGDCPIIQTHGTTPPFDEQRRVGVRIVVSGQGIVDREATTWGSIKSMYR